MQLFCNKDSRIHSQLYENVSAYCVPQKYFNKLDQLCFEINFSHDPLNERARVATALFFLIVLLRRTH